MYIVVRQWSDAAKLIDAMQQRQQDVTDIIRGVPGFVAYYATRSGDTLTTVTVCDSQEGAEESTRLAGDWVKTNVPGVSNATPQVSQGETFLQF
ncbi:hypothetical protein BH23CHL5_BH23CHL5_25250 [soil metagenome]